MLEVAFRAQNQCSYQRTKDILKKNGMIIDDETIRSVTNYVGRFVFKNDCKKAEEIFINYNQCRLDYPLNLDGILYIQTDGAALNTRIKNAEGSTWRENKLGEVFSSNNIHFWTDKHGNRQHRILKREYISYLGKVDEFKWHLLSCAVRGGYGKFKSIYSVPPTSNEHIEPGKSQPACDRSNPFLSKGIFFKKRLDSKTFMVYNGFRQESMQRSS